MRNFLLIMLLICLPLTSKAQNATGRCELPDRSGSITAGFYYTVKDGSMSGFVVATNESPSRIERVNVKITADLVLEVPLDILQTDDWKENRLDRFRDDNQSLRPENSVEKDYTIYEGTIKDIQSFKSAQKSDVKSPHGKQIKDLTNIHISVSDPILGEKWRSVQKP